LHPFLQITWVKGSLLALFTWDNRSFSSIREICIIFIDYLGKIFFLIFSCGTIEQANYACDGCVFAFILLVGDTYEQANTRKI
jgi:hypothetical protein